MVLHAVVKDETQPWMRIQRCPNQALQRMSVSLGTTMTSLRKLMVMIGQQLRAEIAERVHHLAVRTTERPSGRGHRDTVRRTAGATKRVDLARLREKTLASMRLSPRIDAHTAAAADLSPLMILVEVVASVAPCTAATATVITERTVASVTVSDLTLIKA